MTSNNQQYHSGSDYHQLKCWESLRPKPEYFTQLDKIIQDLQSIDRREAVVARNLEDISANFSAVGQPNHDEELTEIYAWLEQQRTCQGSPNSKIMDFAQAVEEYVSNVSLRTNPSEAI